MIVLECVDTNEYAEAQERKVRPVSGFTAYIYGQKRVSARKVVNNNCQERGVALMTNQTKDNQILIVFDVGLCNPFSSRSLCRVFVFDDNIYCCPMNIQLYVFSSSG